MQRSLPVIPGDDRPTAPRCTRPRRSAGRAATGALLLALVSAASGCGMLDDDEKKAPDPEAAQKVADGVPLTPEEWGGEFTRAQEYEDRNRLAYGWLDDECTRQYGEKSEEDARPLLAYLSRAVQEPTDTPHVVDGEAWSGVMIWAGAADTAGIIANSREEARRCPTQDYGEETYEDIKEATPPKVPGATEVFAAEGLVTNDGEDLKYHYTSVTAVIDNISLSATVEARPDDAKQARAKAGKALRLMAGRL